MCVRMSVSVMDGGCLRGRLLSFVAACVRVELLVLFVAACVVVAVVWGNAVC